jgi:hypothetical protein
MWGHIGQATATNNSTAHVAITELRVRVPVFHTMLTSETSVHKLKDAADTDPTMPITDPFPKGFVPAPSRTKLYVRRQRQSMNM